MWLFISTNTPSLEPILIGWRPVVAVVMGYVKLGYVSSSGYIATPEGHTCLSYTVVHQIITFPHL